MAEVQFRFRADEPVADPAVTVDAFGDQTNAAAVRLEPGDDARDLLPSWAGFVGVDLSPWPALVRYKARMEARPGVAATLAAEREAKKG